METRGQITLRDEIYLDDAYKIADWLENENVTKYLSEGIETSREIKRALMYTTCPVVTHLFCSNGNFYMIDLNGRSIGYLKLIGKDEGCELVIAIGDEKMWNKGYGSRALKCAMEEAYFNQKYKSICAKIFHGNTHSLSVFKKAGFILSTESSRCSILNLDILMYLKLVA